MMAKDLTPTHEYDISVPVDDGVPYIVFGTNKRDHRYHIARLKTNMVELAEEPREIIVKGGMEPADKPNIHIRKGVYYLSAGANYAVSDTIYGPYHTRRSENSDECPYGWNQRAHGNFFEWNNQWFYVWCRYTERGHPHDIPTFRESLMVYVHYRENGDMVYDRDFLDAHGETGVGQYSATWDKIEAEWFMAMSGGAAKTELKEEHFEISNIRNGAYLRYPNIHDLPADPVIEITYASNNKKGGEIFVHADDENGPVIGKARFKPTGSWATRSTVAVPLKSGVSGETRSVAFVFNGDPDQELVRVDSFKVQSR